MELDSRSRRLGVTLGVTEEESGFLRFQSLIMFYFCKKRRSGLTRCLKFTEKVSFNIASEACGQTVLPDKSILIGKNW